MVEKIDILLTEEMIAAFILFHVRRGEDDKAYMWAEKLGPRYQMQLDLEPKLS